MADFPSIPEMVIPSIGSTVVFVATIAFVAVSFIAGVWRGGTATESAESKKRWGTGAAIGMFVWLVIGAVVPLLKILETKTLPPPFLIFVGSGLLLAVVLAFSPAGKRLAMLPFAALIGFHTFRLPLELVLHSWYSGGTLPVQMTYEGHNFDIATGILAITISLWGMFGTVPRAIVWFFNIVGASLLLGVICIAITSSPVPFRQYMNEPPVLLIFHFPYSWIVTIGVAGALLGHLILFRKLLSPTQIVT